MTFREPVNGSYTSLSQPSSPAGWPVTVRETAGGYEPLEVHACPFCGRGHLGDYEPCAGAAERGGR